MNLFFLYLNKAVHRVILTGMIGEETERMTFREITFADVKRLGEILSSGEAMRYYPKVLDRKGVEEWIARTRREYREWGYSFWGCYLKEGDVFVGVCGLHFHADIGGKEEIELAYLFDPQWWGKGLASEAARQAMDYAERKLNQKRLISLIRPENGPSCRLAERNGLTVEQKIHFWGQPHLVYTTQLSG
ncbi:MAG: GNAT family N-acetyltransferase [Chlamydiia bacterium]|nr:GNAT family N-acetyltransferase [Chlamydiia bacterium]